MERVDVIVAGGGLAGLAAAAGFGSLGLSVLCVDPAPAREDADDLRTTAILRPGRALLAEAGLWAGLEREAAELRVMRVVDAGGRAPVSRDFVAGDAGVDRFGWNVPNRALLRAFAARLAALPGVASRRGVGVADRFARGDEAIVALSDGGRVAARLLVAADGRDSPVRRLCGIDARVTRYDQTALVFAVAHDRPHDGVSVEVHRAGGPFTLVPLPDREGRPASAVVWMERTAAAMRLQALAPPAFAAAATERSAGVMGPLDPIGPRQAWPVLTQVADRLWARRTALVAEAAHVLPPIGAQGFNASLADLRALLDLARARPSELGLDAWLSAYARMREGDVRLRAIGVDALNRASMAGLPTLRLLRGLGLRALHDVAPVRRSLVRLGLGAA